MKLLVHVPLMHPHFIVLMGFAIRIYGLVMLLDGHVYQSACLLMIGMILDFTDGQFARHTNTTSSLGALYDLASDFLCSSLMLLCFFYLQTTDPTFEINLITLSVAVFGYLAFYLNVGFYAYISWRQEHGSKHVNPKSFFLSQPIKDVGNKFLYDQKLAFMRWLFDVTWIPFSKLAFAIPGWKERLKVKSSMHIYALGSMTMQTVLACLFIISPWPLYLFFIYQIVLFSLFVLLLQFNEAD